MANRDRIEQIKETRSSRYQEALERDAPNIQRALNSLPPRHARGCPKNLIRAAVWQLRTVDLSDAVKNIIIEDMEEILPCLCPKAREA